MEYDPSSLPQWQANQPQQSSPFASSPYQTPYYNGYDQPVYRPAVAKQKKQLPKFWLWALITLFVTVAAVLVTVCVMGQYWNHQLSLYSQATTQKIAAMQQQLDSANGSSAIISPEKGVSPDVVYAKNVTSVVAVISVISDSQGYYESFGSGFFITDDGYVVTNYHVVEGANTFYVIDHTEEEYTASLVGYDATNDIALLKVEGEGFSPVSIGSSDQLVVGERVAAIGNPLGELTSTLTVGYVSAKDRVITTDGTAINMLQTDAAINSGNSGGPLFNMKGQVVGIITAKYSGTSSSGASIEGIGFAIPMDDVIGMLDDLRTYGYVTGAFLGVYVRDVSAAAINDGLPSGAFVEEPIAGYCAAAAGIQAKDIIVNLGGYTISNTTDLTRYLRKFDGGQQVIVTVYRAGQYLEIPVVLNEKDPPQTQQQEQILMPEDEGFEEWYKEFIDKFFENYNP